MRARNKNYNINNYQTTRYKKRVPLRIVEAPFHFGKVAYQFSKMNTEINEKLSKR